MQSSGTPTVIASKRLCYYKYCEKSIVPSYFTVAILPSVLTDGSSHNLNHQDFSPSLIGLKPGVWEDSRSVG